MMAILERYRLRLVVVLLVLLEACTHPNAHQAVHAPGGITDTQMLAVYEPWFGHPKHISVGYSSLDPTVIRTQMDEAKRLGITGFVVDWYGDREPFLDRSYALIQSIAPEKNFHVAMMYDETAQDTGQATDEALAAFKKFHKTYLSENALGREAYLTYQQRPVIFIFPKRGHTDWNRVRDEIDRWDPQPLLIYKNQSPEYASAFDGFYAWVNPGRKGWAPDGSNWGGDYLRSFYRTMQTRYPNKIVVGGAWAGFDDTKASWGLDRRMSQRCGKTLTDTMAIAREFYPPQNPLPFLLIATWNDYEEGTAIERGLAKCDSGSSPAGN